MEKDLILQIYNIGANLLNAQDNVFERFFENLYEIDKRILYIYIITNKENITKNQIEFAKKYYEKRGHYYNWNLKSIIVCNSKRVSDFLGLNLKPGDNILKNSDCFHFILRYIEFFEDVSIENFQRFNEETSLSLSSIYLLKNYTYENIYDVFNKKRQDVERHLNENPDVNIVQISFNSLGSTFDREDCYFEIYNHDLLIENEAENIKLDGDHIVINGKNIYTLYNDECMNLKKKEKICYAARYEMSVALDNNILEKIKAVEKIENEKYKLHDGVKQLYLSPFQDLFSLYDDGNLYKNNKFYAKDVLTIWEANSYNCYLVFNDYSVENLVTNFAYKTNKSYDKVIFNEYFIAFLKDRELKVIAISFYDEIDTNYYTFFSNVDDIKISEDGVNIDLIIGNNIIKHNIGTFVEKFSEE